MTDLTHRLTVFVITSGEPSTAACLQALHAQDCRFELKTIENVSPMDAAFQQMHDRCETPYFAQVDADMVLNPWAIQRLYNELAGRSEKVAFVAGRLWDDDVQTSIVGVKCYRHAICKRYPYRASTSCEMDQVKRMTADGFTYEILGRGEKLARRQCYGQHLASQTPEMAFRRWKRWMQKYRLYGYMEWLAPYPKRLLDRAMQTGDPIHLWQFLGAVAGLSGPLPPEAEVDASQIDMDFKRLEDTLNWPSPGRLERCKIIMKPFIPKPIKTMARRFLESRIMTSFSRNRPQ